MTRRTTDRVKPWVMACDGCGQESAPTLGQPSLAALAAEGWFIAAKWGDRCPGCVGAGTHVGITPMVLPPPTPPVQVRHLPDAAAAYDEGVQIGLAMAAIKAEAAAETAATAAAVREAALVVVEVTDPTGYRMRPAEVSVVADPPPVASEFSPGRQAPWGVVLDFGPFGHVIPAFSVPSARAIALAFVVLLGCDHDLSALPTVGE
jgi:hypothetical protein